MGVGRRTDKHWASRLLLCWQLCLYLTLLFMMHVNSEWIELFPYGDGT